MLRAGLLIPLLILLPFATVLAADDSITLQILSKYHPQVLEVRTRSRIFRLQPRSHPHWRFTAPDGEDIRITVNGDPQRVYRGSITVDWVGSEYRVENRTPLEIYVAGVVTGELGTGKDEELIKAQAVLARTYALKTLAREPLSDLAYHQVFKGFDRYAQRVYPVSQQTRNEVLQHEGKLADALFHAECGSAIYHAGQFWPSADTGPTRELPAGIPTGHPWRVHLSDEQVARVFPNARQLVRLERQYPVVIDTLESQWPVETFRLMINRRFGWNTIPSNEFHIRRQTRGWQLDGRGRGHLVGLCQQQAEQLAEAGWRYRDILQLFYPELEIATLP